VVTARPQVRAGWTRAPGLRIVHHDEIFEARHLPTFSSFAIEASLARVPDLSDRFLYFNDDMVLGRKLKSSDVMTDDAQARIHLEWNRSVALRSDSHPWRAAVGFANELLDRAFGTVKARRLVRHAPVLMDRECWRLLAEWLERRGHEVGAVSWRPRLRPRTPLPAFLPSWSREASPRCAATVRPATEPRQSPLAVNPTGGGAPSSSIFLT
jgi:hypothetical protein